MYNLVDHRILKGDTERNNYFSTLEEVKNWLGDDYAWCETVGDINDMLREEAKGEAYYELIEE